MTNQYKVILNYNYRTDESTIQTSTNWGDLPTIHQLDALKDYLYLLERVYNETLIKFNNGEIEGTKAIKRTNEIK
jgi:hypothetical protein